MNILPLVFTLLLMLSILTIEKLENFKNKMIVQKRYEKTITEQERKVYNERQKNLCKLNENFSHQQTTFKGFLIKEEREKNESKYNQYRFVTANLIKILYGKADFFKKAQATRPTLIEELLNAVQEAADKMPKGSINGIQDVTRIQLDDPQLQEVFYHMLKGTIDKEEYKKNPNAYKNQVGKTYFPLLTFFNYEGLDKFIVVRLAPTELLLAIYGNPEIVQKVIETREELSKQLRSTKGTLTKDEAKEKFKTEFESKQSPEITDILDYSLSKPSQKKRI